ncbi:MAG: hypothetical protein AAGF97_05190 [Planctomycetota bacterium]
MRLGWIATLCRWSLHAMMGWSVMLVLAEPTAGQTSGPPDHERVLELFQLNDVEDQVLDGTAVTASDLVLMQRCADLLARVPLDQLPVSDAATLQRPLAENRLAIVQLEGRFRELVRRETDNSSLPYRGRVELTGEDGSPRRDVTVYLQSLPKPWQQLIDADQAWDERVRLPAMLFKRGDDAQLILVADRVGWYPDRTQSAPWVDTDHILLADHGLDVGRLMDVEAVGPLSATDAEAFYAALSVAAQIPLETWQRESDFVNVIDLLKELPAHRGKLYRLEGTARRILKVLVEESAGLDHYYEIELFTDPAAVVRVRGIDDSRVFATYPVVFCCASLPPGCPEGEEVHVPMEVTGFYFKTWQYKTAFMQELPVDGGEARQTSPLLIGQQPKLLPQVTAHSNLPIALFFAGALALIAIGMVWTSARDRAVRRRRRAATSRPPVNPA